MQTPGRTGLLSSFSFSLKSFLGGITGLRDKEEEKEAGVEKEGSVAELGATESTEGEEEEEEEVEVFVLGGVEEEDVFLVVQELWDMGDISDEVFLANKSRHSSYEKAVSERRGSVPVVSTSLTEDSMDGSSSTSKFASFFTKKGFKSNLKRTKSVTKLDRKRPGGNNENDSGKFVSSLKRSMSLGRLTRKWQNKPTNKCGDPDNGQHQLSLINSRIRTSRSHESLLSTPASMHSIDLSAPDIEIKPLHSSILGQDHCFQVSTSNGSKYYSCRTAEEREKWIQCLRKTVQPNQEKSRRTDNSLKISIQEAKNVMSKKRYFCEMCLDKTLYARTSSKTKGEMLFWGEQFDFNNLPAIETITVNIYKEADKKKKKDKNQLLGYVHIPVEEIMGQQMTEKWYTASSATVGKAGKETKTEQPIIRLKARYQTVQILPMDIYQDFINYLTTDYCTLVELLEPVISVKAKQDLATSLVHILQKLGKANQFLSDIVMADVDRQENENLTFRGNSIATKAMEAYLKLVGEKYLQDTLGDLIKTMLDTSDDCEVDPMKVCNNTVLQRHQTNLVMYCEMAWFKIINSYVFFPIELKEVFASFRERCNERKKGDIGDNLISASIFLRFLCPAILSPSMFGLTQEYPNEKAARNLTLIAKTIQTLANFTKFGGKEEYMTFMNELVDREAPAMSTFLQQISTTDKSHNLLEFDGYIDLGKELSILQALLSESMEKCNESTESKLAQLKTILGAISEELDNPKSTLKKQAMNNIQIYDNMLNIQNMSRTTGADSVQNVLQEFGDPDSQNSNEIAVLNMTTTRRSRMQIQRNFNVGSSRPAAEDLTTTDDYVMFSAIEGTSGSQSEALNHGVSTVSVSEMGSRQRLDVRERERVNERWNKMVNAAEAVNGEYVDLISFVDDGGNSPGVSSSRSVQNDSLELEGNVAGSQISISQLSNIASSGYQSFAYSQSSSPVDSVVTREREIMQPLSFANPLFKHNVDSKKLSEGPLKRSSSVSSMSSTDDITAVKQPTSPLAAKNSLASSENASSSLQKLSNLSCSSSSSDSMMSPLSHRRRPQSTQSLHKQGRRAPSSPVGIPRTASEHKHSDLCGGDASSAKCFTSTPLRSRDLSKSADFVQLKQKSPRGMKRTTTDTMLVSQSPCGSGDALLSTPPESPRYGIPPPAYARRSSLPQSSVRMGIRSVQRKISEQEKGKQEYEQEIERLDQQLQDSQYELKRAMERIKSHENNTEVLVTDWERRLEETEERMRRQQQEKDEQMKNIIQRLMAVEEELRKEQAELHGVVGQKQKVIEAQERRIQSLDAANTRLLTALNQLKDRYQLQVKNGMASPTKAKLSITENGEYKSSSC